MLRVSVLVEAAHALIPNVVSKHSTLSLPNRIPAASKHYPQTLYVGRSRKRAQTPSDKCFYGLISRIIREQTY